MNLLPSFAQTELKLFVFIYCKDLHFNHCFDWIRKRSAVKVIKHSFNLAHFNVHLTLNLTVGN